MRKEFLQVETKEEIWKLCPWAAEIIQVEGGFMVFESSDDAEIWENQK